jgi:hypothetical protein
MKALGEDTKTRWALSTVSVIASLLTRVKDVRATKIDSRIYTFPENLEEFFFLGGV